MTNLRFLNQFHSESRNMKLLKVTFIFVISFFAGRASAFYDPAIINCYIRHLKSVKILDNNFLELMPADEYEHCSALIKDVKDETIIDVVDTLITENNFGNHTECLTTALKTQKRSIQMIQMT